MGNKPKFSFIIPAFNEEKYIGKCLEAIFASDFKESHYEIIVVDNGSTDATLACAKAFPIVKTASAPEFKVGGVRNYGARISNGDVLIFLDADCLIDKGWLRRAEKLLANAPFTVFGGGCKLRDNPSFLEKYWLLEEAGSATMPRHLIGASIVMARPVFEKLGGFDESVSSGEDTLMSQKAQLLGFKVALTADLNVVHLGNATTVRDFIRRQEWHAESYFVNPLGSLKDPVFVIIVSFSALLAAGILTTPFLPESGLILVLTAFSLPTILSIKRIGRARLGLKRATQSFIYIYFLDLLYIVGRAKTVTRLCKRL